MKSFKIKKEITLSNSNKDYSYEEINAESKDEALKISIMKYDIADFRLNDLISYVFYILQRKVK